VTSAHRSMNMTFLMARTHPSHDYLNPAVAAFLRESSPPGRMLDFGCGNGSLITHSAFHTQKICKLPLQTQFT